MAANAGLRKDDKNIKIITEPSFYIPSIKIRKETGGNITVLTPSLFDYYYIKPKNKEWISLYNPLTTANNECHPEDFDPYFNTNQNNSYLISSGTYLGESVITPGNLYNITGLNINCIKEGNEYEYSSEIIYVDSLTITPYTI